MSHAWIIVRWSRNKFPHPPRVGFALPRLGAQAGKPERRGRGTPPFPLTLAPDDLHRTGSAELRTTPLTPTPVYVQMGVPCNRARVTGPRAASPSRALLLPRAPADPGTTSQPCARSMLTTLKGLVNSCLKHITYAE